MVRNYVRKTDRAATYTREQLLQAVEKVKNGELTAYRAAIAYKIPRPTIVARVYDKYGLKSKSLGRSTVIPEEIEKKLAINLHEMEKYGFGLSRTEIMELVGDYVTKNMIKNPFKNGMVGQSPRGKSSLLEKKRLKRLASLKKYNNKKKHAFQIEQMLTMEKIAKKKI
ncbi:unnamed protein product [Colias eurytheme]|nr:unnamed protein product [Colias eurytheme]